MNFFIKINDYLSNISYIKFVIIMTVCSYLIIIPFALLLNIFGFTEIGEVSAIKALPFVVEIIVVVLIVPIIETYIFQFLIIKLLKKIKKIRKNNILIIFISASIFGIQHYYSWIYIFIAFWIGVVLAYSFIIYENKKESAFWVVTVIHGMRNLSACILFFLDF